MSQKISQNIFCIRKNVYFKGPEMKTDYYCEFYCANDCEDWNSKQGELTEETVVAFYMLND